MKVYTYDGSIYIKLSDFIKKLCLIVLLTLLNIMLKESMNIV